jgi:hypothetical protein
MTAQELLPIFKKMLSDYEAGMNEHNALIYKSLEFNENLNRGFCNYIFRKAFTTWDYNELLTELFKDYQPIRDTFKVKKEQFLDCYWYPIFITVNDAELSLKTRIENLKRTIARLEKNL